MFNAFLKLEIFRDRISNDARKSSCAFSSNSFLRQRIIAIFAFSNTDLRAMSRKRANSFFEVQPDPSAMLFDMLIPAPRICSHIRARAVRCRVAYASRRDDAALGCVFEISKS